MKALVALQTEKKATGATPQQLATFIMPACFLAFNFGNNNLVNITTGRQLIFIRSKIFSEV